MKKIVVLVAAMGFFLGFCEVTYVHADCPDYKIVCQDNSCHGSYGTCWHWRKFMCVPCHDNNASVCNSHRGPKCVWFSSTFDNLALIFLCKKIGLPDKYCVVCSPPPPCVK